MPEIGLHNKSQPARKALDRLGRLIESGKFPHHSRLPPERDLAVTLGVGRSTLRKALSIFEAEGKICRHVGRGTFVGNSSPLASHADLLGLGAATPEELLEARLVLEPAIAAFACSCARAPDIEKMRTAIVKREIARDPETYNLWDHTFHEIIAQSTQNPILVALMKALNGLRKRPEWANYKQTRMSKENRRQSAQEHTDIVDGIEARNPVAAYETMRAHLGNARSAFQSWHADEIRAARAAPKRALNDQDQLSRSPPAG
jgi:DNA-binding FadR family transcriptional regulator